MSDSGGQADGVVMLSARIPNELHQRFRSICASHGWLLGFKVAEAIQGWVEKHEGNAEGAQSQCGASAPEDQRQPAAT